MYLKRKAYDELLAWKNRPVSDVLTKECRSSEAAEGSFNR